MQDTIDAIIVSGDRLISRYEAMLRTPCTPDMRDYYQHRMHTICEQVNKMLAMAEQDES